MLAESSAIATASASDELRHQHGAADRGRPVCVTSRTPRPAWDGSPERTRAGTPAATSAGSQLSNEGAELATLLKGLGAYNAANLDGGGSSAMYVAGQGVVNRPSDGTERVVANHLAVFAPATGSQGKLTGIIYVMPSAA